MLTVPQIVRLKAWVSMNPHVNQGQPTLRGSQVTVAQLLDAIRNGESLEAFAAGNGVALETVQAVWSELGAQ
jgi:uncharacterized protein (DUF433 family)